MTTTDGKDNIKDYSELQTCVKNISHFNNEFKGKPIGEFHKFCVDKCEVVTPKVLYGDSKATLNGLIIGPVHN